MPLRKSDVIEIFSAKALTFGLGGIVAIAFAGLLYRFKGEGSTLGLIYVLALAGVASVGYAFSSVFGIRKVTEFPVKCSYCEHVNVLTAPPIEDFPCLNCHRLVPIRDGEVLPVEQVRCGYCNEINYFSDKTEVLICESCDHEVPIAHEEGFVPKNLPKGFAVQDDNKPYDLVLVAPGPKTEEVIDCLQHMLALNRAQVKQIITDAPVKLLTGIARKKAEVLQAQLAVHDATAEFSPTP